MQRMMDDIEPLEWLNWYMDNPHRECFTEEIIDKLCWFLYEVADLDIIEKSGHVRMACRFFHEIPKETEEIIAKIKRYTLHRLGMESTPAQTARWLVDYSGAREPLTTLAALADTIPAPKQEEAAQGGAAGGSGEVPDTPQPAQESGEAPTSNGKPEWYYMKGLTVKAVALKIPGCTEKNSNKYEKAVSEACTNNNLTCWGIRKGKNGRRINQDEKLSNWLKKQALPAARRPRNTSDPFEI